MKVVAARLGRKNNTVGELMFGEHFKIFLIFKSQTSNLHHP
jgi:hypothetical protein